MISKIDSYAVAKAKAVLHEKSTNISYHDSNPDSAPSSDPTSDNTPGEFDTLKFGEYEERSDVDLSTDADDLTEYVKQNVNYLLSSSNQELQDIITSFFAFTFSSSEQLDYVKNYIKVMYYLVNKSDCMELKYSKEKYKSVFELINIFALVTYLQAESDLLEALESQSFYVNLDSEHPDAIEERMRESTDVIYNNYISDLFTQLVDASTLDEQVDIFENWAKQQVKDSSFTLSNDIPDISDILERNQLDPELNDALKVYNIISKCSPNRKDE